MNIPPLTQFSVIAVVISAAACSNVIPMAADHGPIPLDSTRAVAIARRNVCGADATETTCPVYSYERAGGRFVVVLDRRPPAGDDRVAVTLRDNGMRVNVEPVPVATGVPNH